ncbi:hypothetical protein BT96DRAFT_957247 [Gymnopus androsaceus JB14]|uniref:Uncharacterized protein n=1 Tax=Gymnopus androsaceus JB14 TaxID=1447944 RepID=A0A6A4HKP2_9AGAR|nr:hypothetical protein BT96DRAFT_957247 [Gymnopus androsaceus JB14]
MCCDQYCARVLRCMAQQYILDRSLLPENPYGNWNESLLVNEDLCQELGLYLQELGTLVMASKDVVWYCQKVFIPHIQSLYDRMKMFDKDGKEVREAEPDYTLPNFTFNPAPQIVIWYHDEKGEGLSLMIVDFVSAEFGWLRGPASGRSTRRIFCPGKNRVGYFTHENVIQQAKDAMDILPKFGPDVEHIFIFDNATTHKKWADEALSARHMPKSKPVPFKSGPHKGEMHPNFLLEKTIRGASGTVVEKVPVPMVGASHDGTSQSLYFTEGPDMGLFKGMETILTEQGYNVAGKKAQCGNTFNCAPTATNCCMRCMLFNEPDFANVKSLLEMECESRGIQVLFLPKFHCELNPIEQCWGFAKQLYCLCPESSKEEDLERNTIASLDAIPLLCIRRFCNRALRYTDAYTKGFNGREAAYALRHYRGHRAIPADYLKDFEDLDVLARFQSLKNS